MPITTPTGIPTPELPDENNPPADFLALATHLDSHINARFTSAATRDAAFPSPATGQQCSVGGLPQIYRDGAWHPVVSRAHIAGGAMFGSVPAPSQWTEHTIHSNVSVASNGRFSVSTGFTTGILTADAWCVDATSGCGHVILLREFSSVTTLTFVAYSRATPSAYQAAGFLRVNVRILGA